VVLSRFEEHDHRVTLLASAASDVAPAPSDPVLRGAARLSVGVLAVALVAGLAVPELLREAGPVLLVTAAVLGLPHGAVDHLAWGWAQGEVRPRTRVVVGYALAAAVAVGIALLAPLPALLVLLALAAAHFAEGEVGWARLRGARPGWPSGAAAGLAAVALPLVLRPADVRPLLDGLDPGLAGVLLDSPARPVLLALTALLVAAGLLTARRDRRRGAELVLGVAVAAVLPPLAAFAAWFAGWHAVRHTARLVALDPHPDRSPAAGLARFARAAALPSLVALVGTAALALVVGVTGGLLVALLALTVPHTAVVARLAALPTR
jgi:Brp/Blh family beta-carotene 15,15'-monooxygenase